MQDFSPLIDNLAEQGWAVADDFLPRELVAQLQECAAARLDAGQFQRAAVGRAAGKAVRDEVRGDRILWLNAGAADSCESQVVERLEQLRQQLNQTLYLGLAEGEFHFACYPPGAHYQRHLDRFRNDDARVVSVVCYLNSDWQDGDGGSLRLWLDGQADGPYIDLAPLAGRVVLFRSEAFWHAVLPATRQRWSLTGWLRRRL